MGALREFIARPGRGGGAVSGRRTASPTHVSGPRGGLQLLGRELARPGQGTGPASTGHSELLERAVQAQAGNPSPLTWRTEGDRSARLHLNPHPQRAHGGPAGGQMPVLYPVCVLEGFHGDHTALQPPEKTQAEPHSPSGLSSTERPALARGLAPGLRRSPCLGPPCGPPKEGAAPGEPGGGRLLTDPLDPTPAHPMNHGAPHPPWGLGYCPTLPGLTHLPASLTREGLPASPPPPLPLPPAFGSGIQ